MTKHCFQKLELFFTLLVVSFSVYLHAEVEHLNPPIDVDELAHLADEIATAYQQLGNPDLAIVTFRKALKLDDDFKSDYSSTNYGAVRVGK